MNKRYQSLQATNLKAQNRITILSMIREKVMSRAAVANTLGMSRPAVSSIINELMEEGLLKEIGHGETSETGGKRPILLDINEMAGSILSVHYDGKVLKMAICNLKTEILEQQQMPLVSHSEVNIIIDEMANQLTSFLKAHSKEHNIIACGLVLKGIVNTVTSTLEYSVALPEWNEVPIGTMLEKKIKIPVYIENDARAQTLELLKKENQYYQTFVGVQVGDGIGTGVALNNQLYRGAFEGAVNFAHTTVSDSGPRCVCGNSGCWEAVASTRALMDKYEHMKQRKEATLQDIIKEYNAGDVEVSNLINNYTAYWIGIGLANIARVFQPEKIVMISKLNDLQTPFQQKVLQVFHEKTAPVFNRSLISFEQGEENMQLRSAAEVVCSYFYSVNSHKELWKADTFLPKEM